MAIYLVFALKDSGSEIGAAMEQKFSETSYAMGADKWFLSTDLITARKVAEALGLIGEKGMSGVVVSVGGYSGRAQPDVWEWLSAQSNKDA